MPQFLAYALFAVLFVVTAASCNATAETEKKEHYESCWRVLELLCEKKATDGCNKLMVLCGELLIDHLNVSHRIDSEMQRIPIFRGYFRRKRDIAGMRGILPKEQAKLYISKLEENDLNENKKDKEKGASIKKLKEYKGSFLNDKCKEMKSWLIESDDGFRIFLKHWKLELERKINSNNDLEV